MARPMSEALFGHDPRPQPASQGFLAWWAGELAALWPSRSGRLPRDNFVVALYDGKALEFVATSRGRVEEIGIVDCPTDGRRFDRNADLLADQIRHSGLPLVLRLDAGLGLETFDQLPRTAKKELRQIIANRLDGLTPWTAETAVFDTTDIKPKGDGTLEVSLAVVPRRVVRRATEVLEQLGLVPDVVDLALAETAAPPTHDFAGSGRPKRLPRYVPIGAALLVFAGVALGIFAFFELDSRTAVLAQRQAYATMLEQRLEDLPALHERIAALEAEGRAVLDRHLASPSALVTVETLSRVLPDTVWLESLTLADGRLTLTGYSTAVSELPSLLQGDPAFTAAGFTAPSERLLMPQEDGSVVEVDRFSLQADVMPEAGLDP
jgi:general secretion pathway protein L